MRLVDLVEQTMRQHAIDVDIDPGLSPCFVRAMLEDLLENGGLSAGSADYTIVTRALAGEGIPEVLRLSGTSSIVWLATRYLRLPECSNTPWSELDLLRSLSLLRGGLQRTSWSGFRRFRGVTA